MRACSGGSAESCSDPISCLMRTVYGWLLLAPAAILLVAFTHYPAVATLAESFFSTGTVVRPTRFVGLANYAGLLDDPVFRQVLLNNFWFALGTIPTSIALAMLMALWVNSALPARALVRLSYFTPTVLPMIAVANLWLYFYTPQIGLLDKVTALFGAGSHNWLGNPDTVMGCLIAMTIWKEAGFFMIFYLAALQQIPPNLAEAAALEGASRWTFFRRVQFPLLMPTTLFVLVNAVINAFRTIDHIIVMTRGGPDNASTLLLFYVYEAGFKFWDTGYAAALTVVLLAVLASAALAQFLFLERRVHYR
jgi:sn-glycerol 3-phosphate transport system permease protein